MLNKNLKTWQIFLLTVAIRLLSNCFFFHCERIINKSVILVVVNIFCLSKFSYFYLLHLDNISWYLLCYSIDMHYLTYISAISLIGEKFWSEMFKGWIWPQNSTWTISSESSIVEVNLPKFHRLRSYSIAHHYDKSDLPIFHMLWSLEAILQRQMNRMILWSCSWQLLHRKSADEFSKTNLWKCSHQFSKLKGLLKSSRGRVIESESMNCKVKSWL